MNDHNSTTRTDVIAEKKLKLKKAKLCGGSRNNLVNSYKYSSKFIGKGNIEIKQLSNLLQIKHLPNLPANIDQFQHKRFRNSFKNNSINKLYNYKESINNNNNPQYGINNTNITNKFAQSDFNHLLSNIQMHGLVTNNDSANEEDLFGVFEKLWLDDTKKVMSNETTKSPVIIKENDTVASITNMFDKLPEYQGVDINSILSTNINKTEVNKVEVQTEIYNKNLHTLFPNNYASNQTNDDFTFGEFYNAMTNVTSADQQSNSNDNDDENYVNKRTNKEEIEKINRVKFNKMKEKLKKKIDIIKNNIKNADDIEEIAQQISLYQKYGMPISQDDTLEKTIENFIETIDSNQQINLYSSDARVAGSLNTKQAKNIVIKGNKSGIGAGTGTGIGTGKGTGTGKGNIEIKPELPKKVEVKAVMKKPALKIGKPAPPTLQGKKAPPPKKKAVAGAAIGGKRMRKMPWEPIFELEATTSKDFINLSKIEIPINRELVEFDFTINNKSEEANKATKTKQEKPELVKLFADPKRHYHMALATARLVKIGYDKLKNAIETLDNDILTDDACNTLITNAPTSEEIQAINAYLAAGRDIKLCDGPEQYVNAIKDIKNLTPMLEAHIFALNFFVEFDNLVIPVQKIAKACSAVTNCNKLANMLYIIIRLGNILNESNVQGIRLSSITKLNDYKTTKTPSLTLLEYIVSICLNTEAEADLNMIEELKPCFDASKIDLIGLEQSIKAFKALTSKHTKKVTQMAEENEVVRNKLLPFCLAAEGQLKNLEDELSNAKESFKELAISYGEPADTIDTIPTTTYLGYINRFARDLDNSKTKYINMLKKEKLKNSKNGKVISGKESKAAIERKHKGLDSINLENIVNK